MRVLRKGEAFPHSRRRSRGSSFTGSNVIWTSLGKPYPYDLSAMQLTPQADPLPHPDFA